MPKKPNVRLNNAPIYLFHPRNENVKGSFGKPKSDLHIVDNISNGSSSYMHQIVTKDNNVKKQLKIMIVMRHDLFLESLGIFLEANGNFNVSVASNVAEAIKLIDIKSPFDLIIQSLDGCEPSKLKDFQQLLKRDGGQNVALMCGVKCTPREEVAMQQEGIVGFVPRTLPITKLIDVLKFIATGQRYALPEFTNTQRASPSYSLDNQLSHREAQVLCGIVSGQTNNNIARNLGLKEPTVKLYAKNLFRKLNVKNRTQAAFIARKHGII